MSEPRRVTVTSPRTTAARLARRLPDGAPPPRPGSGAAHRPGAGWNIARDIDEQTELGAVYVRTLMRAQLRTAAMTCGSVLAVITGLPLLLILMPEIGHARLCGFPLLWAVLALFVHPIWIVLAARHVWRAERVEREFVRLVERP